jgi:hypothetical protein
MSKTNSNPTLTRGLKALEEYDMPMSAVFTPLHLPGIGRKTLQTLQEYAVEVGVVHPLVSLVQQLLKDEWEAGANNLPGWHMEENQIKQLTKMLGDYL